jgi:GNAT superfamily N-acetyltransferase
MSRAETDLGTKGKAATPPPRPPATLTVRPALRSDAVPLSFFFDTALRRDYFLRRGQLSDMLSSPYHDVWVAELDGILVGVAITTRGTRLVNALVHPAYRGLGIGRALVCCSGAREVRAKLDMSTGDPRPFYRALGFRSTGARNERGNIELMRREPRGVRDGTGWGGRCPRRSNGGGASVESEE